jgi:hypothetical protein
MIVVCFIGVNSSHLVGYYEFARWVIRLIRIFACIVFFEICFCVYTYA